MRVALASVSGMESRLLIVFTDVGSTVHVSVGLRQLLSLSAGPAVGYDCILVKSGGGRNSSGRKLALKKSSLLELGLGEGDAE